MKMTVYQSNIGIFHKTLDLLISSIRNNNNNNNNKIIINVYTVFAYNLQGEELSNLFIFIFMYKFEFIKILCT